MAPGLDLDLAYVDLSTLNSVSVPVFVIERDADGRAVFTAVNAAHTVMSGLTSDDVRGRAATDLFPGRQGQFAYDWHAEVLRTCIPQVYPITLRFPGGERTFEVTLTPLGPPAPDGGALCAAGTMLERTVEHDLRRQELAVEAAHADLLSDSESFVSMAAHDLRGPMRHVQQITALLREDFNDHGDGKLDLIDLLEDVATQASALIGDVLTYARAAGCSPRTQQISLASLAQGLFALADLHGQHDLQTDDALIEVDDVALKIVLRNLIENAVKHANVPSLQVRVRFVRQDGDKLVFRVTDNGRGFEDPALAFIRTGDFRYESGFGLLGIQRMLHSRGCAMWAEAPLSGNGAHIVFTLPGRVMTAQPIAEAI